MKVLVYGGTGSQAGPVVTHLLAQGHTPHVVTRSQQKAAQLEAAGAVPVLADLADFDRLCAASSETDAVAFLLPVFLDSPDNGVTFGRHAIDAAVQAGSQMFVWNASGEIPDQGPDTKLAILEHLQASGLPWLVLEPTTYLENLLGPWTAPSVRAHDVLTYPVLDDCRVGWLASDDMGKLVVAALERPQLTGRRYRVSGVETPTGPELAAIFSDACGRDIRYRTLSPEEMGAVIDESFGAGAGDKVAEMYRQEQQDPDLPPKFHDMKPVLKALPVTMTSISDWVKAHQKEFAP